MNNQIQARKQERSEVRLFGHLKYMNASLYCRVVDLSRDGIGLRLLEEHRPLLKDMPVTFYGPELGHQTGVITWYRPANATVGLRLKHTSSSFAQVAAYFRFFHDDMKPVPVLKG